MRTVDGNDDAERGLARGAAAGARFGGDAGLWLAWLALLLLTTGVSRLFVVCTGPHERSTIELVHSGGHCEVGCPAHDGDDRPEPAGAAVAAMPAVPQQAHHDHGECRDRPLRLEPVRELPREHAGAATAPTDATPAPRWPVDLPALAFVAARPFAAPPPRVADRLWLRRSVVLLL